MSQIAKCTITHELEIDLRARTCDVITYGLIDDGQMTLIHTETMPWPLRKSDWCAYGQPARDFLLVDIGDRV